MSFSSNYNELRKKRKKESESNDGSFSGKYNSLRNQREENIAPVKSTVNETSEEKERKWFQKGAFEDGYQFGDVLKTAAGTMEDVASNLYAGITGIAEGTIDTGAYLVGGAGKLLGADKFADKTAEFIAKDIINEEKVGKFWANVNGGFIGDALLGIDDADDYSVLGEKSDSVVQSGGQLVGQVALQAAGVPWFVTSGVTAFGNEVDNAFDQDATYREAGFSGLVSAGAEILTEKLFGGIKFGGKTLDDVLLKPLIDKISSKAVRTVVNLGVDAAGEGFEEVASEFLSTLGQQLSYEKEATWGELLTDEQAMDDYIAQVGYNLFGEEARQRYGEAAIGGAVLGGGVGGFNAARSVKTGRDYKTGLTENEQKVVDNVYEGLLKDAEKDGKKLTSKEKTKLYDEVLEDLKKGGIDIDTIESVLGGETYKTYQDTVNNEEAVTREYEELGNVQNPTLKQSSRYAELSAKVKEIESNSQRNQLKSQLSKEVYDSLKRQVGKNTQTDDYLIESYNEEARRGQAFEADVSKYKGKQAEIVKKAMESGVLNNTRRSHELVDMLTKLAADKDFSVEIFNNEKLKESSFAIDGKKVNGFYNVKTKTLGLNVNSKKYLNSVVGHEVTHILEGTELYGELQKAVTEYAKTKGEYQSRYDALKELYKGIDGAELDAELTADLVGDYLFVDSDFVNNLSVKNRNLFQKIYDEIKYLYKAATAGSKEARELERVKRAFDKAYKESGNVEGETKYSLTEPFTDSNGVHFENAVILDTDFFDGVSPRNWGEKLRDMINTRASTDPFIMPIMDEAGNATMLQFASPNDRVSKNGGSTHKVLNELSSTDDNISKLAVVHIDEVVSVSEENSPYYTNENTHKWLDKNGWLHRNANVINQKNGNIYNLTIDIAKAADGRTILYATDGKIKKVGNVNVNSLKIKGSRQNSDSDSIIPQNSEKSRGNVKNSLSSENLDSDTKYSLSSDSDGKQLTKEQSEYFKDSKMRDDNGNLKVMYHGSQDAGFHEFNSKFSDDDTSFFFVDRNDVAASYSGTSETYEAQTIRSAEDMNNFLAKIGYDSYEAVEKDGKFELLENNEHVAYSDTAQGLYDEFCWYEGVGEGDANYKVYLNLTNPLEIDAKGRPWNKIDAEFSQEVYDKYQSLTAEEKAALTDLAEWEDFRVFNSEIQEARDNELASAYAKMGEDSNIYDLFSVAADNFSEESMRENARHYLKTRDYAQRAKKQGYDGVIFKNLIDNGGYSNGSEGASTVAIAFESNQIKSVANEKPTGNADIRYSLSEADDTYLEAVNKGDTETARKIVEDVAERSGYTIRAYHGTARSDRVGNVFLPERSTSGPMAFFTDNKDIADNYARNKSDTSLAYDTEYDTYYTQFRVNRNGKNVSIPELWNYLTFAERNSIKEKAKHIKFDDDYENIIVDETAQHGNGAWDAYTLNMHRGNALEALVDTWLETGDLFNREADFIQVLELVGINGVEYRDPDARYEKTYDTWLKIQNPFDTDNVNQSFYDGLSEWIENNDMSVYEKETANADFWDKNNQTPESWLDKLSHDIENGTTHAWTVIPDFVTDYLKNQGYDGIKDKGGKGGGAGHTVWIPFSSEQVKSAEPITYDDNGNVIPLSERFNAENPDIRYSLSSENEQPIRHGNFHISGDDVRLEAPINQTVAPIEENISEAENVAPMTANEGLRELELEHKITKQKYLEANRANDAEAVRRYSAKLVEIEQKIAQAEIEPEGFAPITEEEANRLQSERVDTFDDADAPPEMEAPYYEDTDTAKLDDDVVKYIASKIEGDFGIKNNEKKALREIIQRYSTSEIASKEELFAEIKDHFGERAEKIEDGYIAEAKKQLRSYKLYLSPTIKGDIPDFNEFRKHLFGRINTSVKGIPVDSAYAELSELYPDLFPNNIDNPTDQFYQMVGIAYTDSKSVKTYIMSDAEIQEATDHIANEVTRYKNKDALRYAEISGKALMDEIAPPQAKRIIDEPVKSSPEQSIKTVKERLEAKLTNTDADLAKNRQLQSESLADYNAEIERLKDEYELKVNKNTKAANDILRRITRLERLRDNTDADYAKRISDLEQKKAKISEEFNTGRSSTEERVMRGELHQSIIERIKAKFAENGSDLDEVLKKAKNLSTFATVDNTPQRVMEKSLGYKEGQILADETVNKVAQNETEGIKWLNSFTDRKDGLLAKISKQYNIKPGSKESAAAQMYAEGFYVDDNGDIIQYGDSELAKDFPDAKVQANIKGLAGDKRIRQIYDDTLKAINESRTRNAYPEIPKLDNYFLHFRAMDDTFSRLGLPFNPNDIKAKDLPTDLNGVTADLKPGQPYFASAKHREGKRTSFDLLGGLERYLSSAKNQIYHIDDIQTLRALRNYIADTYGQANGLEGLDALDEDAAQEKIKQVYNSHLSTFAKFLNEEANVIAGKTALIDRGVEGVIGRRGIAFLDTINKQVGSNMVGLNVSSSMTNFLAGVQAIAKTNKLACVKALAQTTSSKIGSIFGKSDSFVENNPTIIRRNGAERFYRTPFQKVGDAGYVLMSAVDNVTTEFIVRAKYNEYIKQGMSEQQAITEADKWTSRLMGDRSLGQMPQLYNSKMLGLITKFQLEVRNQLDSQFYDTIQEAKASNENIKSNLERNAKTAAKITATFVELAVLQHLFGKAFESVAGYNPAFDIIDVLIKTLGFDDDEDDEDTVLDNVEEGFFALLEDLPYTSTFTGGRIPISSALPIGQFIRGEDKYGNEKSRLETLGEIAPYYVLPTGYGQIKKTVQGLSMFSDEHPVSGSYTDSGNLRFPVEDTLGNRVQAGIFGQWASENARDYFDNDYAPLKEKQIQEYIDSDMPIKDYREYREGLSGLSTLNEKADYIASLDLPIRTKNLLINNIANRQEDIDLSEYDEYGSFEEFDFAQDHDVLYNFLKDRNITFRQYLSFDKDTKEAYQWASKNPEQYTLSKAIASDVVTYRGYTKDLYDIKADKDSSGKTIVGSRKEKVVEYINNLDASYGERIILFKSAYKADDTYNMEIIDYLNNRDDISYDEMKAILIELGFTVDSKGNIYWD